MATTTELTTELTNKRAAVETLVVLSRQDLLTHSALLVPSIGSLFQPDLAAMAHTKPDLIIASTSPPAMLQPALSTAEGNAQAVQAVGNTYVPMHTSLGHMAFGVEQVRKDVATNLGYTPATITTPDLLPPVIARAFGLLVALPCCPVSGRCSKP